MNIRQNGNSLKKLSELAIDVWHLILSRFDSRSFALEWCTWMKVAENHNNELGQWRLNQLASFKSKAFIPWKFLTPKNAH